MKLPEVFYCVDPVEISSAVFNRIIDFLKHNNILFYDITFVKVIVIEINDLLLRHIATC